MNCKTINLKAILMTILSFIAIQVHSQQKPIISLSEMKVLYAGYGNKIEVSKECHDSVYVSCSKGSSKIDYLFDKELQKGFFIVNPSPSPELILDIHILNNGKDEIISRENFKIQMFPKPTLQTFGASKTHDTKLEIGVPIYFPIKREFSIVSGVVYVKDDQYSFTGEVLPHTLLIKTKVGDMVAVKISCLTNTGSTEMITSVIEILK